VPLIVAGPDVPSQVVQTPVATIDIAPTILALASLPPIGGADGVSLAPLLRGDGRARGARISGRSLAAAGRRYPDERAEAAVIEGRWFARIDAEGRLALYDLETDPALTRDVGDEHRELLERLGARLASLQAWTPPHEDAAATLHPGDEEDLRALGYVR
jgi:choline-sulfatase